MYTAKPGTNVVWNVLPQSSLAYKILRIPVIGQLHCNNSSLYIVHVTHDNNHLVYRVQCIELEHCTP